jgi:hypothetical protein
VGEANTVGRTRTRAEKKALSFIFAEWVSRERVSRSPGYREQKPKPKKIV